MLHVVGVGICRGHITERAKRLIEEAEIVYGSKRALELIGEYVKGESRILRRFDECIRAEVEREAEKASVVVASTGDPMVAGLGKLFGGEVEPGISSVQVALARFGVDLCEVAVVDAHAKRFDRLNLSHRHLLILADKKFDLSIFGHRRVVVLENLCSENERMLYGFADEMRLRSDYSIVFVRR